MTTITVDLTKDTPYEVLQATSLFIKQIASIVHEAPPVQPELDFYAQAEPVEEEAEEEVAPCEDAEVDSDGLPWDGRIHSESRTKLTNGKWRRRRNTPEDLVEKVEAELRGLSSAEVTPPVPCAPPPPPAPVTEVALPPAPLAAPVAAGRTFDEVTGLMTDLISGSVLEEHEIMGVLEECGVSDPSDMRDATPATLSVIYSALEEKAK